MAKSKSSRRWLDRHLSDPLLSGSPSARAVGPAPPFSFWKCQEKDRILAPGMRVLDLGAAPGSWSQNHQPNGGSERVCGRARSFCRWMRWTVSPFYKAISVRTRSWRNCGRRWGRSRSTWCFRIWHPINGNSRHGFRSRILYLLELALDLARERLKPGGALVVKAFQGKGFDAFLLELRRGFSRVASRRPPSSRAESREIYLVAKGFVRKDFHP